MSSVAHVPQDPLPVGRPRVRRTLGGQIVAWLRANLFRSIPSTVVTLLLVFVIGKAAVGFWQWGVANAIWHVPGSDSSACRAAHGLGACWAVIPEKYRFILFGTYPFDEQWRPALAVAIFIALFAVSSRRSFWRKELFLLWAAALVVIGSLMWGGFFGMSYVSQERWGGLPVTLILATFGLAFGFPLGILVALGRRSKLPAIRSLCVLYVELIRGVPLISLLFMASVMFPLFMPDGFNIDKLLRAQIAFILYAGAYLAEVVRGGLQAVPRGQYEAADALGLSYWKKNALIVLPQAIRHVIPPLVNTFIAFFKDTSLVLIIGIFDLLTTAKTAIIDPAWQSFSVEVYIFVGVIYFLFCFAMSRYSRSLEAQRGHG
ncbi:amino acid ABC transporter permease [Bradyrhizobium sp. ISRA443]|uniref:amino acid ABC transporter permease n=1 Tax=unclassified Bradyrhizobium TaxID=2631580 RepID=UPI00247A3B6C|nr:MULTISPECIES: amino acid ABC transporter permease [unclassified Bradyrhizobium]WGR90991.1 amino acid ABC transporter permease [Bradyrhizobium sp. ISRA435]WGS01139.1 amino acid ABC transporter permease [Bradyrhizobium sp. ISRA436]WGS08026.1 amino acid ABC transporter permease [Bradyrhizobium sp. ISRA437]WGS14914.1 amino acid ABC transporter permease [Bradyrhizobium sp. ISRA443]